MTDKEVFLWQDELIIPLLINLKVAEGTAEYASFDKNPSTVISNDFSASGIPLFSPVYPSKDITCSCCQLAIESREELIQHYSEDWHKVNIKRSIEGNQPISLQQYESPDDRENNGEDSDSASESEDDGDLSEEEKEQFRRTPRIYFKNVDGIILSIYKTLLLPQKVHAETEQELIMKGQHCHKKLYWVIILVAGGNFAAAVFKGPNVIVHKTFHSYTIRANQGGSQSSNDNRKGRKANSAGASLRRYNERVFAQHVQKSLCDWKEHIDQCNLIFHRSPLNFRHILFGGQSPVLKKNDLRLRNIPFPTRRPTFKETKSVQHELSKVLLYDLEKFKLEMEKNKMTPLGHPLVKRKCKEKPENVLLKPIPDAVEDDSSEEETCGHELIYKLEKVDFTNLEEFGYVESIHSEEETELDPIKSNVSSEIKEMVYNAVVKGNLPLLEAMHKCSEDGFADEDKLIPESIRDVLLNKLKPDILKMLFGSNKKTILHIAVENSKVNVIWWLLEKGCDPAIEDLNKRLPYSICSTLGVRNIFRRFMSEYPDKFDYKQAKIPAALTKEQENANKKKDIEKKRAYKKTKELKEKERRKEKECKLNEKREQKRFSALSDREKRALAAEKRIVAKNGNSGSIVGQFCHFCNTDITAMVPFSFNNNNFCSTSCVKNQRNKSRSLEEHS